MITWISLLIRFLSKSFSHFFFFLLDVFSLVSQRFFIAQFASSCFETVDQNGGVSVSSMIAFPRKL